MYSEILEDDEVKETEEVDTTKTIDDEHKDVRQESETVRMKDTKEKNEIKSEPEKFQTTCCSIL